MTDHHTLDFETVFEARVRRYASARDVPFDADRIADLASADGPVVRRWAWRSPTLSRPILAYAFLALTILLAVALVGAFIGANLRAPLPTAPLPPTPAPTNAIQSRTNGAIAYATTGYPSGEVHEVMPDGSADRMIDHGTCPRFSRDGSVLAYLTRGRSNGNLVTLTLANPDGSSPRDIAEVDGRSLALSPDGTTAVDVSAASLGDPRSNQDGVLWLTSVADGSQRVLAEPDQPTLQYFDPVWSPDGQHIAVSVIDLNVPHGAFRRSIAVVDVATGGVDIISNRFGTAYTVSIDWSPDGRQLAFAGFEGDVALSPDGSLHPRLPNEDLFVVDVDGSNERNITNTVLFDEAGAQWSPDGTRIAFIHEPYGTDMRLYIVGADSSGLTQMLYDGNQTSEFSWSPDGSAIAALPNQTLSILDPAAFDQPTHALLDPDTRAYCPSWGTVQLGPPTMPPPTPWSRASFTSPLWGYQINYPSSWAVVPGAGVPPASPSADVFQGDGTRLEISTVGPVGQSTWIDEMTLQSWSQCRQGGDRAEGAAGPYSGGRKTTCPENQPPTIDAFVVAEGVGYVFHAEFDKYLDPPLIDRILASFRLVSPAP